MRPKLSCFGISLAHRNTKGGQYGRTCQQELHLVYAHLWNQDKYWMNVAQKTY